MPQFLLEPSGLAADGRSAVLRGAEAHHLLRVLRARPGDAVLLFDGAGRRWEGRLAEAGRAEALLTGLSPRPPNEPPFALVLAQCLPKGDRWPWILEKGTELGVTCFAPLRSRRTVGGQDGKDRTERWAAVAAAAAKQCERALLPEVLPPADLEAFLQGLGPPPAGEARLACVERSAEPAPWPEALPQRVLLAVGPEGGWAPDEVTALEGAGFLSLSLGPRILRAETAAVAALVRIQALWGDLVAPHHP